MKLLDQPIRKTAELSNKEALVRALIGAGTGAGAGMLGEYMMTGKAGWKGALTGGALGTGAAVAIDPQMRDKVRTLLGGKPKDDQYSDLSPEEQRLQQLFAPMEGMNRNEKYDYAKKLLAEENLDPRLSRALQFGITQMDEQRADIATASKLFKDPAYKELMQGAATDPNLIAKLRGKDNDVLLPTAQYAKEYMRAKGEMPTPEHLGRFIHHTRKGYLRPEEWGSYMSDAHELSGDQMFGIESTLVNLASLAPGLVPGASKLGNKAAARWLPKSMQQAAELAAYKRIGSTQLGNLGGKASALKPWTMWKASDKLMLKALTKKHGAKRAAQMMAQRQVAKKLMEKSLIGGGFKVGGKFGVKGLARTNPALGFVMDVPEMFYDPETGKYSVNPMNIGSNISNADRLMELRERHGKMLTGDDRNMLYNVGAGGLQGFVSPLVTLSIYAKRKADIVRNMAGAVQGGGLEGARDAGLGVASAFVPFWDHKGKLSAPTQAQRTKHRDEVARKRGYYIVDGKKVYI